MKRSTPLRRTGFKQPERRPPKQVAYPARPREVVRTELVIAARAPMPKDGKTRPGKRKPTVAEAMWMDAIASLGCIACFIDGVAEMPGAVHHILRGGRRIGHRYTICLCQPGHHMDGAPDKISRHPWKARFEDRYGSEMELLLRTEQMLSERGVTVEARGAIFSVPNQERTQS